MTSSSLYPSMRSPKLTMHAMDSPLARKSHKASARRVAEARKYLTLPGSDGRSKSSLSAYCASAKSPMVNSGLARITSNRSALPIDWMEGRLLASSFIAPGSPYALTVRGPRRCAMTRVVGRVYTSEGRCAIALAVSMSPLAV